MHTLATDDRTDTGFIEALRSQGVEVIIA
jgi:hypothetical protein